MSEIEVCDRSLSLGRTQVRLHESTSVSVCEAWCEAAKRGASLADRITDTFVSGTQQRTKDN
ncbi:MAG: hypothetical protein ICV55_11205 [Coleofasciculus sp. C3-bin4]|nr:hypothetical protein [Coleofasciculus sp. C3-bin4]